MDTWKSKVDKLQDQVKLMHSRSSIDEELQGQVMTHDELGKAYEAFSLSHRINFTAICDKYSSLAATDSYLNNKLQDISNQYQTDNLNISRNILKNRPALNSINCQNRVDVSKYLNVLEKDIDHRINNYTFDSNEEAIPVTSLDKYGYMDTSTVRDFDKENMQSKVRNSKIYTKYSRNKCKLYCSKKKKTRVGLRSQSSNKLSKENVIDWKLQQLPEIGIRRLKINDDLYNIKADSSQHTEITGIPAENLSSLDESDELITILPSWQAELGEEEAGNSNQQPFHYLCLTEDLTVQHVKNMSSMANHSVIYATKVYDSLLGHSENVARLKTNDAVLDSIKDCKINNSFCQQKMEPILKTSEQVNKSSHHSSVINSCKEKPKVTFIHSFAKDSTTASENICRTELDLSDNKSVSNSIKPVACQFCNSVYNDHICKYHSDLTGSVLKPCQSSCKKSSYKETTMHSFIDWRQEEWSSLGTLKTIVSLKQKLKHLSTSRSPESDSSAIDQDTFYEEQSNTSVLLEKCVKPTGNHRTQSFNGTMSECLRPQKKIFCNKFMDVLNQTSLSRILVSKRNKEVSRNVSLFFQ